MNRRKFIGSAALIALGPGAAALLSGCTAEGEKPAASPDGLSQHEMQTLFAVSRALFPHAELSDQPYLEVASALSTSASNSTDTMALLRNAVSGLDEAGGGQWLSLTPEQKVAVLESQQSAPYFALVLNSTIDTVYRSPETWKLVGYEGSSLEHGGYLHRGFDDIDWLASSTEEISI